MNPLVIAAMNIAGPIILELIKRREANAQPAYKTYDELLADFMATGDKILAEIDLWRAAHPRPPLHDPGSSPE